MGYTGEQFGRLPKWAQRKLADQERHIANLIAQLEERNSRHPGTNVKLSNYIYGDCELPPDSDVDFYLGESRQKYQNMITVQHLRTEGSKVLRVSATGRMIITPCASNMIELRTDT